MKQAEEKPRWFYVDEAGDPAFYGKGKVFIVGQEGCSKTFSVGFLRTYDPQAIRGKLAEARLEILNDRYLKGTSQPVQEPVLQVADYVLWAVQRAFERSEMRYFEYMREKIEMIWDLFDYQKVKQGGSNVYDRRKNPFSIEKASPLS